MMAFCISELQYPAILMRLDVGSGANFDRPQQRLIVSIIDLLWNLPNWVDLYRLK
jgi:hypothetical protein